MITLALATGREAVFDFAVANSAAGLEPDSGFCALVLAVFPYISRALLVMFMIKLMSWYDARNTIGFAPTSMLVNCWEVVERLSKENVRSTSSKNRAESAILLMRVSDIPRSSTVKARMPCTQGISTSRIKKMNGDASLPVGKGATV